MKILEQFFTEDPKHNLLCFFSTLSIQSWTKSWLKSDLTSSVDSVHPLPLWTHLWFITVCQDWKAPARVVAVVSEDSLMKVLVPALMIKFLRRIIWATPPASLTSGEKVPGTMITIKKMWVLQRNKISLSAQYNTYTV